MDTRSIKEVLWEMKKFLFYLWSFLSAENEKILSTIVNHLDLEKYDVDILEIEHFDKDMNLFRRRSDSKTLRTENIHVLSEALLWS